MSSADKDTDKDKDKRVEPQIAWIKIKMDIKIKQLNKKSHTLHEPATMHRQIEL